jgi:hypothetical protein
MFKGDPNCGELGFDFGLVTPHGDLLDGVIFPANTPACENTPEDTAVLFSAAKLSKTIGKESCSAATPGSYKLNCGQQPGGPMDEFTFVDIFTDVDVSVFVQGGNGGILYNLTASAEYHVGLNPGNGAPISYIEFCFNCVTPTPTPGPTPAPTPVPSPMPTTESPTMLPTIQPSEAPTVKPTDEPTAEVTDPPIV